MLPTANRGLILCVDDEAAGLRLRTMVLETAGYAVLQATTPAAALELFNQHNCDLVITDHLLGRETGAALALEMKRLKPQVPVIVLSGTSDLPAGLDYVTEFISKAEGPDYLLSRVEAVLHNKATEQAQAQDVRDSGMRTDPSQALLAVIVESSNDAILSKDLAGVITSWNHAAEMMYAYKAEEVIGQPVSMLAPPECKEEIANIMQRLRRGEKIDHYETERITKDGRRLDVSITISPIRNASGRIVGASTIARNITETKLAEQALRNSEKLAVAGRMAATVAHEINNPLEAVNNILYLVERDTRLDSATRDLVHTAQAELRRVGDITKLTLGFYRDSEIKRTEVRIADLIDNVLKLYGRRISSLGINVSKDYKSEGEVLGVSGELRQVFSNLIVNAVDALATTGDCLCVRIHSARNWRSGELGIRVLVADNGPGIQPESRGNIFQPFYTTKGEKGTGIGLWVSKGIVEKHGGAIRLRTSTGAGRRGTCFAVWLPTAQQHAARRSAA